MDMFPQREQSPREFWLAHVQAWRASGLKKKEYCEVHGLKATTMGYWCRAQAEPHQKPSHPDSHQPAIRLWEHCHHQTQCPGLGVVPAIGCPPRMGS